MGTQKQNDLQKRDTRKRKKEVRWTNGRGTFRISEVHAASLVEYLDELLAHGALVSFYSNRERTNVGCRVRHDDLLNAPACWPTSNEELLDYLRAVCDALDADGT